MQFTIKEKSRNVHVLYHVPKNVNWEQHYLLVADVHWDNPKCDRELLKKHFDQAKAKGAGILSFGDFFCAMQGKYDPRSSKKDLRPEHATNRYLDALIDTAAEFLAPYSENLLVMGYGNHETSIINRHETDLVQRLVQTINDRYKPEIPVHVGGYSGYVRFAQEAVRATGSTGNRQSKRLYYHHGAGGGGPVTKGVIQSNRRAAFVDADILVSGHIHESWVLENPRTRLSGSDEIVLEEQLHICLPTYKEEYDRGVGGFHIERGRPPKPLGGVWLRLYNEGGVMKYETSRAK